MSRQRHQNGGVWGVWWKSAGTCSQKLVKIQHLRFWRCHLCHTCYHLLKDLTHGQVWLRASLTSQPSTLQQEVLNRAFEDFFFFKHIRAVQKVSRERYTPYVLSLFSWTLLMNLYSGEEGSHLSQKGSGYEWDPKRGNQQLRVYQEKAGSTKWWNSTDWMRIQWRIHMAKSTRQRARGENWTRRCGRGRDNGLDKKSRKKDQERGTTRIWPELGGLN